DTLRDTIRPDRRIIQEVARRSAVVRTGIADRLIEARYRPEQLADPRSSETFRIGASQAQIPDWLPVYATLERRRRTRSRVIGEANRAGQFEQVDKGDI